jgi:hypothetical protein
MKNARYVLRAAMVTFGIGLFVTDGLAVTVDKTAGGASGYPAHMMGKVALLERTIDFSNTTSLTGTSANVYQMIRVPAGTWVISVGYELETNSGGYQGENGTCTIDVGDGDDTDGYFDNANVMTGQVATAISRWTLGSTVMAVVTGQTTTTTAFMTNVTIATTTAQVAGTNFVRTVTATPLTKNGISAITQTTANVYPITTAPRPYAAGKIYTSADTIDLLLNNNADQLKITLRALVMPVAGL